VPKFDMPPDGLARPEIRPRQRYANIVQVIVRNPQLMRTFRQGRKVGFPAQQHGSSSFVARSSSLCEINLMISSFFSGIAAFLRRRSAAGGWCIACDRNARGEVRR
jgi:hypothetical protein